jgi:hypothetical protein
MYFEFPMKSLHEETQITHALSTLQKTTVTYWKMLADVHAKPRTRKRLNNANKPSQKSC